MQLFQHHHSDINDPPTFMTMNHNKNGDLNRIAMTHKDLKSDLAFPMAATSSTITTFSSSSSSCHRCQDHESSLLLFQNTSKSLTVTSDIAATTTTATNNNAFTLYPPLYMPPPGTLRQHRRRLFSAKIPSSQQTFQTPSRLFPQNNQINNNFLN